MNQCSFGRSARAARSSTAFTNLKPSVAPKRLASPTASLIATRYGTSGRADADYFRTLVEGVWRGREELDARLATFTDRAPGLLDPVERAVLLIALYELTARPEVPYRVAINEAVGLAKRFGATDGFKFVNAVLDRAARALRPNEH